MRSQFPIFQSHLDLTYSYWQQIVQPGDIVIDATCGNGHDTLKLANLSLRENQGTVYSYDIQQKAIDSAHDYLSKHLSIQQLLRIVFIRGSHAEFSSDIHPHSVKLIVYNLGYLPGGDKSLTTETTTTLQSVSQAMKLIAPGGAISITCYPGHPAGATEEQALLHLTSQLDPKEWSCCYHQWINRRQAPSLLFIQKATPSTKTNNSFIAQQ